MTEKKWLSRNIGEHVLRPETLMMSYGYDPLLSERAIKPPIFHASTFVFKSAEEGKDLFSLASGLREKKSHEELGLVYSRINNPNFEMVENRLSLLDHAEESLLFSSGMGAISTTLLSYLRPGDVLIHSEPIYGGTDSFVKKILPSFGIKLVGFAASEGKEAILSAAKKAQQEGSVAAIYIETPANPTNSLVDLEVVRQAADSMPNRKPVVIVDNTLLGPLFQTPLEHGADLVVTSLTKYVGGHSDLVAGGCSGSKTAIAPVRLMRSILGSTSDPKTAWLLLRSLETLKLRMEASQKGAHQVAKFLNSHNQVSRVRHFDFLPENHPDRVIFNRQCKGTGSTFSFEIKGGEKEAFAFINRLKLIKHAVSLGGTESLICHPATTTHTCVSDSDKNKYGIASNLVRISVGIEDPNDLIADITQAFQN